ncbi:MAG: hypothetical protein NVSMB48_08470 [Marmoricola sp.]
MQSRIRVGLSALVVVAAVVVLAPLALAGAAQAQVGRSTTQPCAGSEVTVHAPAPGQTAVVPSAVGLPVQAGALTARASRVHAQWLTSIACRALPMRHGLVPTVRGPQRRMTSMAATVGSYNWSGYDVTTTQTPASVTGSWTEPSVSLPSGRSEAYSAVWVGLGGMSSQGELVQDGTGQDISSAQGSYHFFWYELFPLENAVEIPSLAIAAGDQVSATSSWANGTATFGVCNITRARCLSFSQSSPAPDDTAEWIVEAPQVNGSQATPPVFSPVSFTNTSYQAPTAQTPAQGNAEAIEMITSTDAPLATPGPLSGDAFTVTYRGPAAGPPPARPSVPRSVHVASGALGGALTTVATWVRPATATPVITSYEVRIQSRSPQGVYSRYRYATVSGATTRLNIAGTRGYLYRVEVIARNAVGVGPWSTWSNLASPR